MTDITELAKSLKAAANTTADAIDHLKAFPGDELIDLSQHEGEQVDIDIATLNQWYELSSPANIRALVEALGKAQQQTTESENRVRKQNRHICELFDDNTALRQRIAGLESRTVTFKLPSTPEPSAFAPWLAKAFYQFHKDTVKSCVAVFSDACRAAGIKVEAE
ncbi:hypothetical protein B6J31_23190 [Klebsiella pneumoniae]|nr:hypothetical protein B6J31_23190 [Klebsiella pneumoniae]